MSTASKCSETSCSDCKHKYIPSYDYPCNTCCTATPTSGICYWEPVAKTAEEPQTENPDASDGSTASYYVLPEGATELQDIISAHNMNAQMGEIGRAWMRYGRCPHSPKPRELKKIIFYAQAELDRLEKYGD